MKCQWVAQEPLELANSRNTGIFLEKSMADDLENHDITDQLRPIRPRGAKATPVETDLLPPEPKTEAPSNMIDALIKALMAIAGQKEGGPVKIRYTDDKRQVKLKSNRDGLHVDPAHLAAALTDGTAYGLDGPSRKFDRDQEILMRPGPWVDSLIESGGARMAR